MAADLFFRFFFKKKGKGNKEKKKRKKLSVCRSFFFFFKKNEGKKRKKKKKVSADLFSFFFKKKGKFGPSGYSRPPAVLLHCFDGLTVNSTNSSMQKHSQSLSVRKQTNKTKPFTSCLTKGGSDCCEPPLEALEDDRNKHRMLLRA